MSVRLTELLEHVLDGEPDLADEVDAVFRRADRLRRRRTRALLAAGAAASAAIAVAGYLLATTLLPAPGVPRQAPAPAALPTATPRPSTATDPVLAVLAPAIDARKMHIYPRPPERGNGWRQYSVVDEKGKPRGTVQVAVYAAAEDLCFPVLADAGACARPEHAKGGLEYLRYDNGQDAGWQVRQTIAHRPSDGRTMAVMAAAERAAEAKPPLTGAQIEKLATDPSLMAAFGSTETCTGPSSAACPVFRVPVPTDD